MRIKYIHNKFLNIYYISIFTIKNRQKLRIRNILHIFYYIFIVLLYVCYFLVLFPTGSFQRTRTNRKASRYSEEGTAKVATGSNPRSHARLGSPLSMYVCLTSSVEHTAHNGRFYFPEEDTGVTLRVNPQSRSCLENRDNYL